MIDRAFVNLAFDGHPDGDRIDFAYFGHDVLKSEQLTDLVYQVWLTLMAEGWGGQHGSISHGVEDAAYLYMDGVYLPCVRRATYTHLIDRRNDGLADHAALFLLAPPVSIDDNSPTQPWDNPAIMQVRRLERFPRRVVSMVPGERYKWMHWHRLQNPNRHDRRWPGGAHNKDILVGRDGYFTVTDDDRIVHARYEFAFDTRWAARYAHNTVWPAVVLNAWADRRFLWQVQTKEKLLKHTETPLILGVEESHVQSLFYARSLPRTETGRKRPILHWVRAHERRLREGIEVDVKRHLRGVAEFDMDSLHFQIISPDKTAEQERAA